MNATVETTCSTCNVTVQHDVTGVVLALPAKSDPASLPCVLAGCPACGSAQVTDVPWRIAAYLLSAGATALPTPPESRVRPTYPDRLPSAAATPMTLDDLIDLHAALEIDRVL
jgi:hypothetical protein